MIDSNPQPIHVSSASDERYLPHAATLIESIASANPAAAISFHLLHDGTVSVESDARLRATCDRHGIALETIEPPVEFIESLPQRLRATSYPKVIWYRVWLAELLPELDRVLYLDPDTLVCQDLRSLWSIDLGGRVLGAVRSKPPPVEAYPPACYRRIVEHGYFNSGVLLVDLAQMRTQHFSQRLIETCRSLATELLYPDQDALNLTCRGGWLALHPKWNVLADHYLRAASSTYASSDLTLAEALASPAILHFEGPPVLKPWRVRCVHPHRELYRAYRSRTPWPLDNLEDAGTIDRLLSTLPLHLQLGLSRLKRRWLSALRSLKAVRLRR